MPGLPPRLVGTTDMFAVIRQNGAHQVLGFVLNDGTVGGVSSARSQSCL